MPRPSPPQSASAGQPPTANPATDAPSRAGVLAARRCAGRFGETPDPRKSSVVVESLNPPASRLYAPAGVIARYLLIPTPFSARSRLSRRTGLLLLQAQSSQSFAPLSRLARDPRVVAPKHSANAAAVAADAPLTLPPGLCPPGWPSRTSSRPRLPLSPRSTAAGAGARRSTRAAARATVPESWRATSPGRPDSHRSAGADLPERQDETICDRSGMGASSPTIMTAPPAIPPSRLNPTGSVALFS